MQRGWLLWLFDECFWTFEGRLCTYSYNQDKTSYNMMITIVKKASFLWFAIYCALVGTLVLLLG